MSKGIARVDLPDGVLIDFSDAHYWPNLVSTSHRALLRLCKILKPKIVCANGDVMDGARISKHARIGWEKSPKVVDELKTVECRLNEVVKSAPAARFWWTFGNHDQRFETYLANSVPEYMGVKGFSLREHFPAWTPCWQLRVNGDTVFKHRWKGGRGPGATFNNVKESGTNIFTGHLHSSKTTPFTDLRGTRFGVDSGTLADPEGPQFEAYMETNPADWREGFVVATFANGKLLWPEHVHVIAPGRVSFRGQILEV